MKKIAIDGPSGAGKSTMAKLAARELGFTYVDTGAMYRALGLKALENNIEISDAEAVCKMLSNTEIELKFEGGAQRIFTDGADVSDKIRTPQVSLAASDISALTAVRLKMVDIQRRIADTRDVVMDGRDIGTYVLPGADVKIFLTADIDERSRRRYNELKERGADVLFEDVKTDMERRDKNDSTREMAPLAAAEGAVIIDTTGYEIPQSVELILNTIKEKLH